MQKLSLIDKGSILMQTKEMNFKDVVPHDRLAKVGEILARGIWRLKEQKAQERENGLDEIMAVDRTQKNQALLTELNK